MPYTFRDDDSESDFYNNISEYIKNTMSIDYNPNIQHLKNDGNNTEEVTQGIENILAAEAQLRLQFQKYLSKHAVDSKKFLDEVKKKLIAGYEAKFAIPAAALPAAGTASVTLTSKEKLDALKASLSPSALLPLPESSSGVGIPILPGASEAAAHGPSSSTSTAVAPVQSLDTVNKSIEVFMKKYDDTHTSLTDNVNWKVNKTDKVITITDSVKDKLVLSVTEEAENMQVKFHEPTVSERAAMISISACETPITINSTNLEDLRVLADAAKAINEQGTKKEILFTEETLDHLAKNTLEDDKYKSLREAVEAQKAKPSEQFTTKAKLR